MNTTSMNNNQERSIQAAKSISERQDAVMNSMVDLATMQ